MISGGKRNTGPKDIQHKLVVSGVRGHGRGRVGSSQGCGQGLPNWPEIPPGFGRLRWLLLSEGHTQSRLHMRVSEPTRGRGLLAAGHRHERVPKVQIFGQGSLNSLYS